LKLHGDLPRQGVGADWCTREALGRLPPLRKPPAIIDLGCGPGRQTIVLANHFRTPIDAVDICPLFLDQMMDSAKAAEVDQWIRPRRESFAKLPDAPASFDLVWSEGAAGVLGLQASLELWAPLLRKRGIMVISDCTWLTAAPPAEIKDVWDKAYPGMTDGAGVVASAEAAGLKVFDQFSLPRSAWWDEYYTPLTRRIAALRDDAATDPALAALIAATQAEIAGFERYGDCFGYAFYLMRLA